MKRGWLIVPLVLFVCRAGAQTAAALPGPSTAQLQNKVEAFLRNLYAWGPAYQVKLGPISDSDISAFYQVSVEISMGGHSSSGIVYVSKDGRFLFQGDVHDLAADPFAENRTHLHIDGNPSKGPEGAPVIVVGFSDFQCPHCRLLYQTLKALEPRYPQVRFVFKDLPLVEMHPWAMTAATAGRCAYLQSPDAFWKVHDAIFEHQDTITAENAWNHFLDYATQAGLNPDAFRACMASPEAKKAIEANIADGTALKISSTPTVFVNGRPLAGGQEEILIQYIDYELARRVPRPAPPQPR